MKKVLLNLNFQVLIAILLGVLVGKYFPTFAPTAKIISEKFIDLIKWLIAPIIFLTIVLGIASMGDIKKVGRVGGKAILYFEVITTFALFIGLAVANILKPGEGLAVAASHNAKDLTKLADYEKQAGSGWDFLTHIISPNMFDSFTRGDILQILLFAILFGFGISKMGAAGQSLLGTFDKLAKVFFNIMKMIMRLAPLGAFGGMAYTVGTFGVKTLRPLAALMGSVYLTMFLFIFVVLFIVCRLCKFSLFKYLKFIRQEILVVLGTSSSETVLPAMMEKMEQFGCSKSVVDLVIPTGYSFNLDGTTIYLGMAVIFLAQAFHVPLTFGQELSLMGILMVTSKGAAAVTGGGFIVLSSTLMATKMIPVEGLVVLFAVDRFMSEARAITNMIGNGIAAIVIAKSEKEFDQNKYLSATR
ncbi:C4-dicarboxylate transporter DctA [Mucilaginibacter sp. HMF5004]|uniref:C4-dicarboxylate transporter DctA n=1 Tax=Mucilaginibacter rivuli TaxID=2857527 RepID=UPI001C5D9E60|nr:C4-dicarboxylate transporter DctA [Mucilaginibacter rivuli]MBW4888325.1 C4-dicarboxylate transporter DctA [Mucilaginibacter rivuli]